MVRRCLPLRILAWALALSLVMPRAALAQEGPTPWQALGGPGGRITSLAASSDGGMVYAVAVAEVNRNPDETQAKESGSPRRADALYKSVDRGQRWAAVTNDLPPGVIAFLFVDRDDVVWVGLQTRGSEASAQGQLWSSADSGATWRAAALDRNDLRLRGIAQDADGGLWLLANAGSERAIVAENLLYRRSDNGAWSALPLILPDIPAIETAARLSAHPTDPRLFLTTDHGDALLSVDDGQSWTVKGRAQGATLVPAQLAFLPDQPSIALLVHRSENGLILERSQDGGATWSAVSARGLPDDALVPGSLVAVGNGILLMTTDRGAYRSADAGNTWQALEGALDSAYVYQILSLPDGSLLAGTAYGLFASGDRGALWRQTGAGLPHNSAILGLLTHPNRPEQIMALIRAIGAADASLMLVSRDSGASWLPTGPGGAWTDATAWAIDPRNPDHLLLAGANYVAASMDGGVTWQKRETKMYVRRTAIAIAPSDPQRVYVDGAPILTSRDGGETWVELAAAVEAGAGTATGIAVDPADANRIWYGAGDGVRESRDGGQTWQRFGLDGQSVRWLQAAPQTATGKGLQLFAGINNGGIMRWDAPSGDWQPAQKGLPAGSNMLAFASDAQAPGLLWATRDGGGIYASADGGANWQNAGRSAGENLGLALAPNYSAAGGWFVGTANAGIWLLGAERVSARGTPTPPGSTSGPTDADARSGVDARIEVLWPHNFAPLQEATLANAGIRLFLPRSLEPPSCGWRPSVELWRAIGTEPATRVEVAEQRAVDGQPFAYWDANDVDVSAARAAGAKVYFLVKVDGVDTATSVWAHAGDARTFFPEQLVPSGIATGAVDEVDARIQIVWPHDEAGNGRDVKDASFANVAVTLFKRGTRLSVPLDWRPPAGDVRLVGAWNSEVSRAFNIDPLVTKRQSGVITYPVWEFNDVPVDRARSGMDRLYLWTTVDGVRTYPTIWAHGLDSRTYFPAKDEPVLGCLP